MENMLAHELIHAYDVHARRNMNWMDLKHHACSEVRAANLSDCHWYVYVDRLLLPVVFFRSLVAL